MPMGVGARKYYVVSTMLTNLASNANPMPRKRKAPTDQSSYLGQ